MNNQDLINTINDGYVHVVILGTGASIASCSLNPEVNNKKIPLLRNIHETIDLKEELMDLPLNLKCCKDFEKLFSNLYDKNPHDKTLKNMEEKIYRYFSALQLPESPTIYDYLILSLRNKDIIATFNWDPFLWQAYLRNKKITSNLPRLAFLHGSVAIGICKNSKTVGPKNVLCNHCNKPFEPLKLLYPIHKKGYNDDSYIKDQWEIISGYLNHSAIMTVFGYSAPKTDVEAVSIIRKGFINDRNYVISDLEIIDIAEKNEIRKHWSKLINSKRNSNSTYFDHINVDSSFFNSSLAKFSRRTGEAFKLMSLDGCWDDIENRIPKNFTSMNELHNWFSDLLNIENNHK